VNVQVTLLPADNDQLAAKVESAFTAKKVPDVMMLYSGAYTTAYTSGLLPLGKYVNATPGFYKSLSNWDLSCAHFNCGGGSGTILGVPTDDGGFFLFYNRHPANQGRDQRAPEHLLTAAVRLHHAQGQGHRPSHLR
jgi:ABC-type glycerol-3-phosphate transport system substrate-binding protein